MTTISSAATIDDAAADDSDEVDSEADDEVSNEDFLVAVDANGGLVAQIGVPLSALSPRPVGLVGTPPGNVSYRRNDDQISRSKLADCQNAQEGNQTRV